MRDLGVPVKVRTRTNCEFQTSRRAAGGLAPSDQNALDFIKRDLVLPSIVETCRARALVVGHLLSHLEFSAVAQVLGDASGSEGVAPDLGSYQCRTGAAADHSVDVRLAHRQR